MRWGPLAAVAPQPVSAAMGGAIDAALAVDERNRQQSLGAWRALLAGPAGVSPVSARPGRVFRNCPTCPELVVVPVGTYQMGSGSAGRGRSD